MSDSDVRPDDSGADRHQKSTGHGDDRTEDDSKHPDGDDSFDDYDNDDYFSDDHDNYVPGIYVDGCISLKHLG